MAGLVTTGTIVLADAVFILTMAAAVVTSCSSSSLAPSQTEPSRSNDPAGGRVLFIGNSLTEANATATATYLAALVIYQQITGRSPVGLPAWTQMPADRARLLQEAAQEANAQFGRRRSRPINLQ